MLGKEMLLLSGNTKKINFIFTVAGSYGGEFTDAAGFGDYVESGDTKEYLVTFPVTISGSKKLGSNIYYSKNCRIVDNGSIPNFGGPWIIYQEGGVVEIGLAQG